MKKLRIGVLMGGRSLEKEVSFNSGRTVCDHLNAQRYTVIPIFQKDQSLYLLPWYFLHRGKTSDFEHRLTTEAEHIAWDNLKTVIDFMYIAQHGRFAEDGTLQGFLDILGIPYLGSNVMASALRADKIMHKQFLTLAGITTPRGIAIEPYEIEEFQAHRETIMKRLAAASLTTPYIVKPYDEGSSLGVSVVTHETELERALRTACFFNSEKPKRVLLEEKIDGMEFTCIILTDYKTGELFALPPTEVVPEDAVGFNDYEQKYMPGRGIKYTPARCTPDITQKIQSTCIEVMQKLELRGISRIDGFVCADGTISIIDSNSFSGMGPSSYIFNQATAFGMSTSELINHIIETELDHYGMLSSVIEHEKTIIMNNQKKRVAVLLGGRSNEKETSLDSGRNVFFKLDRALYDPIPLFIDSSMQLYHLTQAQLVRNTTHAITEILEEWQKVRWNDLPNIADFVFIALHGGEGEDGSVQGTLEMLKLPYNGSSVLASALCMNKYKANQLLAHHGFDVPLNQLITRQEWHAHPDKKNVFADFIHAQFANNESLIVKPHNDGCSVMVKLATNYNELIDAIDTVLAHKDSAFIEERIMGMELTVGVVGNQKPYALPPSQAIATKGILSIEEKFLPGAGENQTPAPLTASALHLVQKTMVDAYKTVGCKGYARIDCFYQNETESPSGKERVVILEINSLPGLTPATCLFHQAAEVGMRPSELLNLIIQLGEEEKGGISCETPLPRTIDNINASF